MTVNDTAMPAATEMPENYFVRNRETGKLELHFAKETYLALDDDAKKRIKSAFLWGRNSGCWISRCMEPNLYYAERIAKDLGLFDAGTEGERLSFADRMALKAQRAERRADRFEARADAAESRSEALQKPIRDMHGDVAFFTQPNINTSAGRAFTRRRDAMFAAFDKGFEEFRKSEYWRDRAATARVTADQKQLSDKGFVMRRIKEREHDIRALKNLVTEYQARVDAYENGRIPVDRWGSPIKSDLASSEHMRDQYLDRLEAKLDELGFYQDCLDRLGGVQFSPANIKPGYVIRFRGRSTGRVISVGPKNCTVDESVNGFTYVPIVPYAEIDAIITAEEIHSERHPFVTGDQFTCSRWNRAENHAERMVYTVIKATDKSVTLQTGNEKPFVRVPKRRIIGDRDEWVLKITDWHDGIIIKPKK